MGPRRSRRAGSRGNSGGRGGPDGPHGERARLFVALELPDEAREAVVAWRADALVELPSVRLTAPEDLHATLCFLGWRPAEAVPEIATACQRLACTDPFILSLEKPAWLPPRRPRVLAVRLSDPDGGLARLQSELSRRLSAGGWYEPEARAYLPHVTVARVPGRSPLRAVSLSCPPALAFRASHITLYRSRLGPAGARYEALSSVVLH